MALIASGPKAGRIGCSVPGCGRTFKSDGPDDDEVVCGKHWRLAPPRLRARVQKLRRLYRVRFGDNAFWAYPAGSPQRLKCVQAGRLFLRAWQACRDAAIEKAMGL